MSELLDDSSRGRVWVDHEGIQVPPAGPAALCQHWRGSERGRQGLLQTPGHKLKQDSKQPQRKPVGRPGIAKKVQVLHLNEAHQAVFEANFIFNQCLRINQESSCSTKKFLKSASANQVLMCTNLNPQHNGEKF